MCKKWIYTTYLLVTSRKGVSSLQLSQEISLSNEPLGFGCNDYERVYRKAIGIIEIDESYFGGKEPNKHVSKKLNGGRGAIGKQIVLGMRERSGRTVAKVIDDIQNDTIHSQIESHVEAGSTTNTDEHGAYEGFGGLIYKQESVKLSAKEFVNGMAHTNEIESVWAVMKRGYNGVYHNWSTKHCHRHIEEFAFRLNEGLRKHNTADRMKSVFRKMVGKAITYERLISNHSLARSNLDTQIISIMNECNVPNRTIFLHDNLEVLQNINSECIDLIYLDPPFNKNKVFTAPIGSSAEGAEFSDIFREEDVKDDWLQTIKEDQPELHNYLNGIKGVGKRYNFAYLAYMAIRLVECQRILKKTGSVYLHCDPTMSHYLKTTMDCIFGESNFRNEVVWKRSRRGFKGSQFTARAYNSNTDSLLFYVKSKSGWFDMSVVLEPYSEQQKAAFKFTDAKGNYYRDSPFRRRSAGARPNLCYEYRGFEPPHVSGWQMKRSSLEELDRAGDLEVVDGKIWRKIRPKDGTIRNNLWDDITEPKGKERTGYPTQKPLALLDRIIKASSNQGDMVLDPFCGCATACIAAERLERQWAGVDVSHRAYELVKKRLDKEVARPDEIFGEEIHLTTKLPVLSGVKSGLGETKHVYIISHPNFPGEYKVGIAKNVRSRLNSYQTSDPDRAYKLEFSYETRLYRETESHIHQIFENKHEWVSAEIDEIKQAIVEFSGG